MRNLHTIFPNGYTSVYSQQHWIRVPFSPQPLQHLLLPVLLIIAILTCVRWHLTVVLYFPNCLWSWPSFHIPVGHLYIFLGEVSVQTSAHFLIGLFGWFWVVWILYTFWLLTICQNCCLQISSPIQLAIFLFCWHFPLLCRRFFSLIYQKSYLEQSGKRKK